MKKKKKNVQAQLQLYEEAVRKRVERPTGASNKWDRQVIHPDNKKPPQGVM